jgi:anti-anti-sigma factor
MKRHRTAAGMRPVARSKRGVVQAAASRTYIVHREIARSPSRSHKPTLTLASPNVRAHTLILTGELDRRSAPALEAEMERLYGDGITALTLDLRELMYIDSIGIAVIAFRWGLCKRRGQDLALIPGSRLMRHALERAGVTHLLPFREARITAAQPPAAVSGSSRRAVSSVA